MRIAASVLAVLFGGLHLVAGATQFRFKDPAARGFAISMACGGICLIFESIVNLTGYDPGWMDALGCAAGCLLICGSAYANGRRSGDLHPSHHIIRGAAALLLVINFFIW